MRGEMRRSMRGERDMGDWHGEQGWSGDCIERPGMMRLTGDLGENMWHCHHLMSRVWPMMIRYLHVDRYIPGPGPTLRDTRTLILVAQAVSETGSQCVWGGHHNYVCAVAYLLRVCLPVVTVLPSDHSRVNVRSPTFCARDGWSRH